LESLADCCGYSAWRNQSAEPSEERDFPFCMVIDTLKEDRRHCHSCSSCSVSVSKVFVGTEWMMSPTTHLVRFNVDDARIPKRA